MRETEVFSIRFSWSFLFDIYYFLINKAKAHDERSVVRFPISLFLIWILQLVLVFPLGAIDLQISELMSSNGCAVLERRSGDYPDWFELYNSSNDTLSLDSFSISDNGSDLHALPAKKIAPGEYCIFWCDGVGEVEGTLPFKLSSLGEELYLYNGDSAILDSVIFPVIPTNFSYEKVEGSWLFSAPSTPAKAPLGYSGHEPIRSASVHFSPPGRLCRTALNVSLSAEGEEVYYTLDGSEPTRNSQRYKGSITLDSTTIIRARTFCKGKPAGEIGTEVYLFDTGSTLPVLSFVTAPDNLWEDSTGIYCVGKNGISRYGLKANYYQSWDRPIKMQLFDEKSGAKISEAGCGLSVVGERRHMPQKTMKIFARNKYGSEVFSHRFFPEKKITEFRDLFIRNTGYNDYASSLIRSGFMHNLIGPNTELDYLAYKPVTLFLNGEYWGFYTIRERLNGSYIRNNHSVDSFDLIEFKVHWFPNEGDSSAFQALQDTLNSINTNTPEGAAYFRSQMDINNLLDNMISQLYVGNGDWPGNNQTLWKERGVAGKWRWVFDDVDAGCGLWAGPHKSLFEQALAANSTKWNNKPPSTLIFRKLLENDILRAQFVQRCCVMIDVLFTPERSIPLLDSMVALIEAEMPRHLDRWTRADYYNDSLYRDGTVVESMEQWYKELDTIREFLRKRPVYMREHMQDYFDLDSLAKLTVVVEPSTAGGVVAGGYDCGIGDQEFTLFSGLPLEITAKAAPGFRFSGKNEFKGKGTLSYEVQGDDTLILHFEADTQVVVRDTIRENRHLTALASPYLFTGDVVVDSGISLTIEEGTTCYFEPGSSLYVYGLLTVNGSKDSPVQLLPRDSSGRWGGIFCTGENISRIRYTHIQGATSVHAVNDPGALCAIDGNLHIEQSRLTVYEQPIFVRGGSLVAQNCTLYAEGTCDYINVKRGEALVEWCHFIGNKAPDTDAIDYDGVVDGVVRYSTFADFSGYNSDAIDLGEACRNVLVSCNSIQNCSDKGISVGQASSVVLEANIIAGCQQGVGIKDVHSYAEVTNCTLDSNGIALAVFEKNSWAGGGGLRVTNTILSRSINADYLADDKSGIGFRYSISDRSYLPGEMNRRIDPKLQLTGNKRYAPLAGSPCLNSGDPNSAKDSDGSRADIGAYCRIYGAPESGGPGYLPEQQFALFILKHKKVLSAHIPSVGETKTLLYNSRGQLLQKMQFEQKQIGQRELFSMKDLAAGFYVVHIQQAGITKALPLIWRP